MPNSGILVPISKSPRVIFKYKRIAEGDWQIEAHYPGAEASANFVACAWLQSRLCGVCVARARTFAEGFLAFLARDRPATNDRCQEIIGDGLRLALLQRRARGQGPYRAQFTNRLQTKCPLSSSTWASSR